jgi:hypothetical protein
VALQTGVSKMMAEPKRNEKSKSIFGDPAMGALGRCNCKTDTNLFPSSIPLHLSRPIDMTWAMANERRIWRCLSEQRGGFQNTAALVWENKIGH